MPQWNLPNVPDVFAFLRAAQARLNVRSSKIGEHLMGLYGDLKYVIEGTDDVNFSTELPPEGE